MEEDELFEEVSFIETVGKDDSNAKMRTMHLKHNEEMNYNCRECNVVISAHNKDWHDNKCDHCFDKIFND